MKASDLAGTTVTLKLKSADFRIRTRSRSFDHATRLAANIYAIGRELLEREIDGTPYRLIGIGVSALTDAAATIDFIERRTAEAEAAIDRLRRRFGDNAVVRGLAFDEEEQA
jgi:DNA polymerase-4